KIQSSGASLLYSSYLGGSSDETGEAIAVDSNGGVYVTGITISDDFPVTINADRSSFGDASSQAFATKLNPAVPRPSALIYSDYFGGDGEAEGTGIAVDTNGNFYVCGLTDATNLLTTAGAYRRTFAGGFADAFAAKFSSVPDLSVSLSASSNPVLVGSN